MMLYIPKPIAKTAEITPNAQISRSTARRTFGSIIASLSGYQSSLAFISQ
jgi:hypothetical protein